jgi:hypothetical protein
MTPAYLVLETLVLEVLVALLEHLTSQLQVAFNHLLFPLLVFIVAVLVLVLTLVPRQLYRLRLEHRICDPDLPVPAC